MEHNRNHFLGRLLVWLAIIAFSLAWGYSAALADDDEVRLTALVISGPDNVNENGSSTYTATARFSDGSQRTVTSSATWSENSSYATISGGTLRAGSVNSNQAVTITARYSSRGSSRSAQKTVTILNGVSAPALTGVSVTGASSINESSTAAYSATATFSDGSSRDVTSSATWGENSQYSTISAAGVLSASSVTGNQPVTITAGYTSNGVTRSGTIAATIIDVSSPPPAVILQSISIVGPDSVNESSTTNYSVSATMSNGTTKTVSAAMAEDSQFASFSASSLVTTAVTGNQLVNVSASYSEGGITKTAGKAVSILDNAQPPPVPSGSHADRITVYEGTKTCLQCHRTQAISVHNSEHYQWAGKLGKINDFCIYPDINQIGKLTNVNGLEVDGGCSKCHVGKGAKPAPVTSNPTDAQLENIDCLICHSPNYKRTVDPVTKAQWIPDEAAMGMPILSAAVDIQKTSRGTCLNCHTKSGGGNNFKRGDIEEHHRAPTSRAFDVHMSPASLGGGDLHCTSCHMVSDHKIAGKGVDLRVQEGTGPACITCHTANPPHSNSNINSRHLKRVNCTVCHIPTFAKVAPTDMFRDWSAPGELNLTTGLYDPQRTMQGNVTPQYGWWDGKSTIYEFGTAAVPGPNGNVSMAGPSSASAATAGAKISAFKYHTALQPIDTVTRFLLPLKIGQFYMHGDLVNAIPLGQDGVGWPRNPYDYQKTERWMGLFHEVSPKENALGYNSACTTCHGTTTPKVPLKSLGYTIKTGQTTTTLCSSCHDRETYSFSAVHPRHTNQGYDCSRCHNFSKAP